MCVAYFVIPGMLWYLSNAVSAKIYFCIYMYMYIYFAYSCTCIIFTMTVIDNCQLCLYRQQLPTIFVSFCGALSTPAKLKQQQLVRLFIQLFTGSFIHSPGQPADIKNDKSSAGQGRAGQEERQRQRRKQKRSSAVGN